MTKFNDPSLTQADWAHIYSLVGEVLEVIKNDDTGVTFDLADSALIVAEILGIDTITTEDDDEPEPVRKVRLH